MDERSTQPPSLEDARKSPPGSQHRQNVTSMGHGEEHQQQTGSPKAAAAAGWSKCPATGGGLWEVSLLVDSVSATLRDTVSMSEKPAPVTMRGAGTKPPKFQIPNLRPRALNLSPAHALYECMDPGPESLKKILEPRRAAANADKSMAYAAAYAAMNNQHHTNFILYPPVSPIQAPSTAGHINASDPPRSTRHSTKPQNRNTRP